MVVQPSSRAMSLMALKVAAHMSTWPPEAAPETTATDGGADRRHRVRGFENSGTGAQWMDRSDQAYHALAEIA